MSSRGEITLTGTLDIVTISCFFQTSTKQSPCLKKCSLARARTEIILFPHSSKKISANLFFRIFNLDYSDAIL